jgi:hypothetical protein
MPGAFGERLGAHGGQHVVRGSQLLAGVGAAFSRRSHSPYSRCARPSSGRSRVRLNRSIASRYKFSAVSPALSSARERASTPRPKSVPPAWVNSASRVRAPVAMPVSPVRAAASISSGSAHMEM